VTSVGSLYNLVRDAWASVPPPPTEEMESMAQEFGEEAERAFVGVAPIDVDIDSTGFEAATPLLDLPARAAAAYLGTFLMSLLKGLEFQQAVGIFTDVLSRAHTIACLTRPSFWDRVRPFLPQPCRQALKQVVSYLASQRESLALTPEQVETLMAQAAQS